jgi:YD repeat-containing protein
MFIVILKAFVRREYSDIIHNSFTHDNEHRLTGISGNGSAEAFSYDGAGSCLESSRNGVTAHYVYDINGSLIKKQ